MTENEAIKEFQQNIDMPFGSNISREASELAIWVLEKQIPMKPILKNGETGSFVDYENGHGEYRVTKWQDWVCPICGWFVGQRYNYLKTIHTTKGNVITAMSAVKKLIGVITLELSEHSKS